MEMKEEADKTIKAEKKPSAAIITSPKGKGASGVVDLSGSGSSEAKLLAWIKDKPPEVLDNLWVSSFL
jgi:hypothetical protein